MDTSGIRPGFYRTSKADSKTLKSLKEITKEKNEKEKPRTAKSLRDITREKKDRSRSPSVTLESYHNIKNSFSDKTWRDPSSLYDRRVVNYNFPEWSSLPKGINPIFLTDRDQFTTDRKKGNILFVDAIRFEGELSHWIAKVERLSVEELKENLINPSIFQQFSSVKNLVNTEVKKIEVELYLDKTATSLIWKPTYSNTATSIPLSSIDEILVGAKTKGFEAQRSSVPSNDLAFSIVFDKLNNLNFMTKYKHKVQLWVAGLIKLIPPLKVRTSETILLQHWESLGKKTASQKEISLLLEKLGIKIAKKALTGLLGGATISSGMEKLLSEDEYVIDSFLYCVQKLSERKEWEAIFQRYVSKEEPHCLMDEGVLSFLIEEQKEYSISMDSLSAILKPFRERPEDRYLTLQGFASFMMTPLHDIFNEHMNDVYQDMSRPLTDYYCFSSHNTYLEGNQISGVSSSEMYIRVLKAGCRCVELDCWDGDDGEPIIFHGRTLTSKILFKDAIRVIRSYSFIASEYPMILSLENHCSVIQQKRMAEILLKYLKGNIARPICGSGASHLPSPDDLKGKFLIKGKVDQIDPDQRELVHSDASIKIAIAPELAAITYLTSTGFSGFEQFAVKSRGPWDICSFVETKAESLSQVEWIEFNKRNFARIYPKGSRTLSSNYNPDISWNAGAQLVALNLQTPGKHVWTNEGRFRDNGGCGYVLKPPYLLHDFNEPFNEPSFTPENPIRLLVDIISARQLPSRGENIVSPAVSVTVRGFKSDVKTKTTNKVKSNGFNPQWDKKMVFDIKFPEAAVLLFVVYEAEAKKIISHLPTPKLAYYSLPVAAIKEGYRTMKLSDTTGNQSPVANLLCYIKIERL